MCNRKTDLLLIDDGGGNKLQLRKVYCGLFFLNKI
jgi:hypothetical protein